MGKVLRWLHNFLFVANHERFTMRKHRGELLFCSRLWHKGIQVCISCCIIKCGTFFILNNVPLFSSYILCIIIYKTIETKCCSSLQKKVRDMVPCPQCIYEINTDRIEKRNCVFFAEVFDDNLFHYILYWFWCILQKLSLITRLKSPMHFT